MEVELPVERRSSFSLERAVQRQAISRAPSYRTREEASGGVPSIRGLAVQAEIRNANTTAAQANEREQSCPTSPEVGDRGS